MVESEIMRRFGAEGPKVARLTASLVLAIPEDLSSVERQMSEPEMIAPKADTWNAIIALSAAVRYGMLVPTLGEAD